MEFEDYYKIMGVKENATPMKSSTPTANLRENNILDVSKEQDAESKFKEVGEAYEVLHDHEKNQNMTS
jgi:curved DNA-binding protein